MATQLVKSDFFGSDGVTDWNKVTVQQLVDHEIREYARIIGGECGISAGVGIYAQNCEAIADDIPNILEKI
eukprot:2380485-Karenia_brevis.AAC.1